MKFKYQLSLALAICTSLWCGNFADAGNSSQAAATVDNDPLYDELPWFENQLHKLKVEKSNRYAEKLNYYVYLLCMHDAYEQTLFLEKSPAFVDEFLAAIKLPKQTLNVEDVSWEAIARRVELIDVDRSDKLFRAGFESWKSSVSMAKSVEPARIVYSWLDSLRKRNKYDEMFDVTNECIAYLRTVKSEPVAMMWLHRYIKDSADYLRGHGRVAAADLLQSEFDKDEVVFNREQKESKKLAYLNLMKDPALNVDKKIVATATKAYEVLDAGNCEEGQKLLEHAVKTYEDNCLSGFDNPYWVFSNVQERYAKCGKKEVATAILWRLVLARAKSGLDAPPKVFSFHGHSNSPESELESLINSTADPELRAQMKGRFVAIEKEYHRPCSIVLQYPIPDCETYDRWKDIKWDRTRLFDCIFQTAGEAISQDQFEKAKQIWKFASILDNRSSKLEPSPVPLFLDRLGHEFLNKDRLDDARDVLLVALERSTFTDLKFVPSTILKSINLLASKYVEQGKSDLASKLLESALAISRKPKHGS